MPGIIDNELGKVVITEDIVAMIAGYAALENYGLVDMHSKSAADTLIRFIGGESRKKGVRVSFNNEGKPDIDLFVKLMYGLSMSAVAQNIISHVRYRVEEMTGLTVNQVNIHIEGVWVDSDD